MGRDTGVKENQASDAYAKQVQAESLARANAATDKFNSRLATLAGGGSIATNPFTNPQYLSTRNLQTAAGTSAANSGTKEQMNTDALKGGLNTSSRRATFADLGRSRMRTNADTSASQASDDYNRYLDWQKFVLGSTLAPTNVDTSIFSTSTGQRTAADKSLADIGIANQQMWGNIISGIAQGAGAAIGGACPVGGTLITLNNGATHPVEAMGSEPVDAECVEVMADGARVTVSTTHTFQVPSGGYVYASECEGWTVCYRGTTVTVRKVTPAGIREVYPVKVGGDHRYMADGFWSLE